MTLKKLKELCVCPLPPCLRCCMPRSYVELQRHRTPPASLSPAAARQQKLVDSPDPRQQQGQQGQPGQQRQQGQQRHHRCVGEPYPNMGTKRALDMSDSEYTNL